jgi:hypothetical protein
MIKKNLSWYKPGKKINVRDKMQTYTYTLSELPGKRFAKNFRPELTPEQMLVAGVFEGKYMNDGEGEYPSEWYTAAKKKGKLSVKADPSVNEFKIKSRLSLQKWRNNGWIPITEGDKDIRGWFQWYCRYWIGRRMPIIDEIQIKRWRAFIRHRGAIMASLKKMTLDKRPKTKSDMRLHRPKQRQALLQWAYKPYVKYNDKTDN